MSRHLYHLFVVLSLVLIPLRVRAWSWKPLPRTSYCSFLDGIEVIYHLGDYLLLSVTPPSKQQPGEYYVYNWKSGHMFGQPLEQAQLFGQLDSPEEGRLLFATTFDMCSLQLDSRPRRRRKRQFDLATDLGSFGFGAAEETTFEKRKAAIMQEMESKLTVLQQDNKKELAKAVIDLKHQLTSLGNSLLLSQAQQRLVLSSMVMRRPEENSKKKTDPADPVASTTLSPEMVVHEEMMAKLEALHKNLSDLTSNLKPGAPSTVATDAQVQSRPPPVGPAKEWSPSGALSAVNERSLGDLSLPSPPCPTVTLATFTTSEYNWEGRICGDRRSPWLKSYLYEYEGLSQTQPPNLTPMMLDEVSFTNLLNYRGRVHLHEETSTFVLVRNDLACPMEDTPPTTKLLAGFRLHGRMFVQMKKGLVRELANSRYLEEVSISELLNCYGNSSLFTEPFTILGGAPRMPYPINPLANSEETENEYNLGRPSAKLRTARRKDKKRIQEEDSPKEDDNRKIRDRDDEYNFGNFKKKNRRQEPRDGQNRRGFTSPKLLTRPDKRLISSSFPPERNGPFGPGTENGRAGGYGFQSGPVGRSVGQNPPPQGVVGKAPLGGSVSVRDNAENQRQQQEAKQKYMFYAGGALFAIVGYCCFCTSSAEQIELQKRRQRKSQRKGRKHKKKGKKKRTKGKTKNKSRKFKRQRKEDSDEDDGDDFDFSRASKRGRSGNASRSRQRQESKRQSRRLRQSLQSQAGNYISKQQSVHLTPQVLAQSYAPPPQDPLPNVYQARAPVLTPTHSGSVNDPNEVIVLDADKVQQFCATDADMASRFESMFGESKLIAQLMDVKRQLGEGQLPEGLVLEPPACGTPSSLERMNANSGSLSLSPALSTKEQSTNYTSEDESIRLIEVLHRLRKSLSSKTNADMPSR